MEDVEFFKGEYRIYTPDNRGHGRTNNPSGGLSFEVMADDIAGFCAALQIQKPCVCGWSDGGQIALELGIRHPDLPAALVLGAVSYMASKHIMAGLAAFGVRGPGDIDFEYVEREFPDMVAYYKVHHSHIYGDDYWRTLLTDLTRLWLTFEIDPELLSRVTAPALLLIGDRDEFNPLEHSVEMYRKLPDGHLAVVPGADHDYPVAHADDFCRMIRSFFQDHA